VSKENPAQHVEDRRSFDDSSDSRTEGIRSFEFIHMEPASISVAAGFLFWWGGKEKAVSHIIENRYLTYGFSMILRP